MRNVAYGSRLNFLYRRHGRAYGAFVKGVVWDPTIEPCFFYTSSFLVFRGNLSLVFLLENFLLAGVLCNIIMSFFGRPRGGVVSLKLCSGGRKKDRSRGEHVVL